MKKVYKQIAVTPETYRLIKNESERTEIPILKIEQISFVSDSLIIGGSSWEANAKVG
jgi:hypothetical protein